MSGFISGLAQRWQIYMAGSFPQDSIGYEPHRCGTDLEQQLEQIVQDARDKDGDSGELVARTITFPAQGVRFGLEFVAQALRGAETICTSLFVSPNDVRIREELERRKTRTMALQKQLVDLQGVGNLFGACTTALEVEVHEHVVVVAEMQPAAADVAAQAARLKTKVQALSDANGRRANGVMVALMKKVQAVLAEPSMGARVQLFMSLRVELLAVTREKLQIVAALSAATEHLNSETVLVRGLTQKLSRLNGCNAHSVARIARVKSKVKGGPHAAGSTSSSAAVAVQV